MRYGITVDSFIMSIKDARHFYGTAWRYNDSEKDRLKRIETEDITTTLTKDDAIELNKRELAGFGKWKYRAGDETLRFKHSNELIAAGYKLLREKYNLDDDVEIELNDHRLLNCDPF